MKRWKLQDAKARLSELIRTMEREGPQLITNRGAETAVLVPYEEWRRAEAARGRSAHPLLDPEPRFDMELPERRQHKSRGAPDL